MDIRDEILKKKKQDAEIYGRWTDSLYQTVNGKDKSHYSQNMKSGIAGEMGMVLEYYHMAAVEVPMEIPEEERFQYMLNRSGLMYRSVQLTRNWWKEGYAPLLCQNKETEEYRCLLPGRFGGYRYYDTQKKKEVRVGKGEADKLMEEAVILHQPLPEERMTILGLLRFLTQNFLPVDIIFLLGTSLVVTLLGLILPVVNQFIFHSVIPSGNKADIPNVMLLLLGVVVSTSLFQLFRSIWIARMGDKIRNAASLGLWNRILQLPARFFQSHDGGEVTSRALMLGEVCDALTENIVPVFLMTLFSVVYLFQISGFSLALVMPTLLILLLMLGVSLLNSWFLLRMHRRENQVSVQLSGLVYQLLSSVETLKVNRAESRAYAQWARLYKEKMEIVPHPFLKYADGINYGITLFGSILIYKTVFANQIDASSFISFQVAFGYLTGTMVQLAGIVTQLAFVRPALQMLNPFLEEETEKKHALPCVEHLDGKISFSNLSFRYSPDMDDVIHQLDMTIEQGEYVALTGTSGCGKSTLFRLMLGFETPNRGAVLYDDHDLAELDKQSVRKRIGTVLQDGMLFAGDIFSNIALCSPGLTMDDAWKAAEMAGCAQDIQDMPMGMFTMVGDGGSGLSGGQKQRILIARALAMEPDIMLLDEATSALDNVTQGVVVDTLAQKKITRIVIAHRLSTIQACDRIFYMESGRVVEEGTYEQLMEQKGKFYQMAQWQLEE